MSQDDFGPIVARTLLHCCHISNIGHGNDGVIVSEIIENDKGETKPYLRKIKNPEVRFWITQEPYRVHDEKKEFESIRRLDEYKFPYKDKDREIFKILNGYYPQFMNQKVRRELQQSPYLYGGNISVEALIAMKYKKDMLKAKRTPHEPTTGFFDIEKSLLPDTYGRLPLMSFTAENQVFLAMKESFMNELRGNQRVDVTVEDVQKAIREHIDPLVTQIFEERKKDLKDSTHKLPFHYHFFVGETEVDMIRWIFGKMHETQVSFIGIWNLGFDIPEVIDVLEKNNIPLNTIFTHPSLKGTGFDFAQFKPDLRKVAHFTQKWHWLTAAAHFQFVDSMGLYSYIRIVDGKEASYKLDDILKKVGLGGKLKAGQTEELEALQQEDWHREMLKNHFTNYAIYAMWDTMSLQILEWRNNDLRAMMTLGDVTPPKNFVNQTIRVTNTMFQEWLADGDMGKIHGGHVLGTGIDVEGIIDEDLLTAGGAVLAPQDLIPRGMKLFVEWPNHRTNCYAWQNDLDFSAQYPNNIITINISKQTKIATIRFINAPWIDKRYNPSTAIEVLCSYLITPNSNGVELGTEFFNLPDYEEMASLFNEHLSSIH